MPSGLKILHPSCSTGYLKKSQPNLIYSIIRRCSVFISDLAIRCVGAVALQLMF